MPISLTINGRPAELDIEADTPLLWALRDTLSLTGTKYGCGIGACGACTVHLNGEAVRACAVPVAAAAGSAVVTIEGLGRSAGLGEGELHPVQRAWIDIQVPQCGYCQSGMIMAAAALLKTTPQPSNAEIEAAIGNLCRCGTYPRVRRAIHAIAQQA